MQQIIIIQNETMPLLLKIAMTIPLVGIMSLLWKMFWSDMTMPGERFAWFSLFVSIILLLIQMWSS